MTELKKNKVALITGGSKGIGFKIAKILAEKKYNIIICSRKISDILCAKKNLESYGIKCLAIKTDVSSYAQCKSLVKNVIKKFSRIDLLINNAGIQGPIGKLWQNNLNEWRKTIDINLMGNVYMSHLVIPYMLKQRSGLILNLSGGGGAYTRPFFSAYASSKTAILRLTETLGEELNKTNIKVFAIAPGTVWTNMTRKVLLNSKNLLGKKMISELNMVKRDGGTPLYKLEELICYLLSKDSRKLSGKLIHVNELGKIIKIKSKLSQNSGLLRRVDYT